MNNDRSVVEMMKLLVSEISRRGNSDYLTTDRGTSALQIHWNEGENLNAGLTQTRLIKPIHLSGLSSHNDIALTLKDVLTDMVEKSFLMGYSVDALHYDYDNIDIYCKERHYNVTESLNLRLLKLTTNEKDIRVNVNHTNGVIIISDDSFAEIQMEHLTTINDPSSRVINYHKLTPSDFSFRYPTSMQSKRYLSS